MYFEIFILIFVIISVNSFLFKSLNAVLDYAILNGLNDLTFNAGVAIAKGQLDSLEKNVTEEHIRLIIQTLQKKCDILLDRVIYNQDLLMPILDPKLWMLDSCPKLFLRTPTSRSPIPPTSIQGPPLTEDLSDDCLRLLLHGCHTPKKCILAEITDNAVEYETTHQVLYWTIFNQKCTTIVANTTIIQDIIKHKCLMILREYRRYEEVGFTYSYERDLYLEQFVVCGIHGFMQFFTVSYEMISSLQLPRGCFSTYKHGERPERRCGVHMSGVTTAALGVLIRHQLTSPGEN